MNLSKEQLEKVLSWQTLTQAINDIFTVDVHSPLRHHHYIQVPDSQDATLLLMPAWIEGKYLGVKQVNVFPGNSQLGLPGLTSQYTLSCGRTGQQLALMNGNEITSRRTAAASALASSFLSREDSKTLLIIGSGQLARRLVPAHQSVRPIEKVLVWNINEKSAKIFVDELLAKDVNAEFISHDRLQEAVTQADIISCASLSTQPIVKGEWLQPGTHLDLVGSFTPMMREADNRAIQRAACFVDVKKSALAETGELIIPIKEGAISEDHIIAEFSQLCSQAHTGRTQLHNPREAITLFKSVGDSREDLAAAILAYQSTL